MAGTRSDLDMNAMTNTEPDIDLDLYCWAEIITLVLVIFVLSQIPSARKIF